MASSGSYKRSKTKKCIYARTYADGVIKYRALAKNHWMGPFSTVYEAEVARDTYLMSVCPNEYYYLYHPELFPEPETLLCDRCDNLLPRALFTKLHSTAKYLTGRFFCRACQRLARTQQHDKAFEKGTDGPQYYEKDFHKFLRHSLVALKSKAKRRGLVFNITLEDTLQKLDEQKGRCAFSGLPMTHEYNSSHAVSVDRKDSSKGYSIDNIHLVRREVNFMKRNMTNEAFYLLCKKIAIHGKGIYNQVDESHLAARPSMGDRRSNDKRLKTKTT